MTSGNDIYSFKEMATANGPDFGACDYIYYCVQQLNNGDDLLIAFSNMLQPEVSEIEGRALISTIGALEKYKAYREQGRSPSEAQFWANLFLVSDFFEKENPEGEKRLGAAIAACWNARLQGLQAVRGQAARIIEDEEDGICVTVTD